MRRYVLPPEWQGGPTCVLAGEAARYLQAVLRLVPGNGFPGLDREGRRYRIEVLIVSPGRVELAVRPEEPGLDSGPRPPRIVLIQALPKGRRMDQVIRQAAEAGVARVIPVESSRSVARIRDGGGAAAKRDRWERIVREALQQSGSDRFTEVDLPRPFSDLPSFLGPGGPGRVGVFFHESPLDGGTLHRYLSREVDEVVACVGPEGGYSGEEIRFLDGLGFLPAHLGPTVLRTETAALYAVAAIQVILMERSSWIPTE
ncbi:MAG TPA: RsmE family RNA methyltransferase [Magnetospirillaceae bacterium]|nr:RsmE family RNA methyltransferase [Magnetospirillaceae bacterium]